MAEKSLGGTLDAINPFSGPSGNQDYAPPIGLSQPSPTGADINTSGSSPSLISRAGSWLGNNIDSLSSGLKTAAPLIGAGGALNSIIQGPGKIPQKGNIQNLAGQLQGQANTLQQTAQPIIAAASSGNLPPGMENQLDTQLQQKINQIKAKYANLNLAGSTMEQQEIQAAQNTMAGQKSQEVQSYLTEGTNILGQASSTDAQASAEYQQLAQYQLKQQEDLQNEISQMLQAFGGGSGGSKSINLTGL